MTDENGTERRIADAAALASMAVQIGNLAASMIRIEAGQAQLLQRLEAAEQRSAENCRTCTTWERLSVLEKFQAGATEKMKPIDKHEERLRFLEVKVAGIAGIAGLASAYLTHLLTR